MKHISEVLEKARIGNNECSSEIEKFIKGFPNIILRGAGRFGTAFGASLLKKGIKRQQLLYWDLRSADLREINGVSVMAPFALEFDRKKTLIINCIPNGSLSGSAVERECLSNGYHFYLSGMAVFEALMCQLNLEAGLDPKVCIDTDFCNWCACKRLSGLLFKQCRITQADDFEDKLVLPVATFVISQKCTLRCLHCGQYMNQYSTTDRINFPLERIKRDIDRIFDAIDVIGYVSVIGGEPFLHPELTEIVDFLYTKTNFGVLGITTNGICSIGDKQLSKLKNSRTRLIFSDYTSSLIENQRRIFEKNVERVAEGGINFTVGQPLWVTPPSLRKLKLPTKTKIAMKSGCNSRNSCKTIQNGFYYPCSTTAAIGSHHLASYPFDWVEIDKTLSDRELREKIKLLDDRPYYESCDHCGEGGEFLQFPGEQAD